LRLSDVEHTPTAIRDALGAAAAVAATGRDDVEVHPAVARGQPRGGGSR
jgi:hypothetical protein